MKKYIYIYLIIVLFLALASTRLHSQCGCSGAPIGGSAPLGGTAGLSNQSKGKIFALAFFRHIYGDTYFSGSKKEDEGYIKYMNSSYTGILLSYGLSRNFSIEAESGYFIRKKQDFGTYGLWAGGLSHLGVSLKFLMYSDLSSKFHIYSGLGLRAPLNNFSESSDNKLPQHLKTSSGAFGSNLSLLLSKGFKGTDLNLYFINRFDYNFNNYLDYRYGPSIYSSLAASKKISGGLSAMLELRNEFRFHDYDKSILSDSTGSENISLVPALSYKSGIWNLSASYELPLYKYFNGSQLSQAYGFNIMLSASF